MSIFPTVQAHLTLSGNFIRYNKTRKNGIPIASCKKFSFFFLSFSFLGGVKREKKVSENGIKCPFLIALFVLENLNSNKQENIDILSRK